MYSKIQITGQIEVITGMHIGGNSAFAAIGAIDSPVVKDTGTNLPLIPGSSLKGKIRTLLARKYNQSIVEPNKDAECIARVFGSAGKDKPVRSRLIFSDMLLSNKDELRKQGVQTLTEVKFENSINRQTAVANPRQIERVIRGAKFDLDIIYEVDEMNDIYDDLKILSEGMKMLQYDYLGGSGSRGYGKVKFKDIIAEVVIGEVEDNIIEEVNKMFSDL
ncbi:MAG: type III-A CRISPR-associated RAMP protein Csm3 [Lachnospiraceae bacterium]|nr:type III-A CRISPR-associated RAMP protein Csm3 [Lachnospiraceae bacterium]